MQKTHFLENIVSEFFINILMKTFSCELCHEKRGLCVLKGRLKKSVKAPLQVLDFTSIFDLTGALGALKSHTYIFFFRVTSFS